MKFSLNFVEEIYFNGMGVGGTTITVVPSPGLPVAPVLPSLPWLPVEPLLPSLP
jgi:hypothetical protein